MPKKTRREKILADLRYQFQASVLPEPTITAQAIDAGDFAAIKKDLTRTLILAAAAISVELLLSMNIGK